MKNLLNSDDKIIVRSFLGRLKKSIWPENNTYILLHYLLFYDYYYHKKYLADQIWHCYNLCLLFHHYFPKVKCHTIRDRPKPVFLTETEIPKFWFSLSWYRNRNRKKKHTETKTEIETETEITSKLLFYTMVERLYVWSSNLSIFSITDLTSEFWQMMLSPECLKYTAFSLPRLGQFKKNTSPMGLLGVLGFFQRLMKIVITSPTSLPTLTICWSPKNITMDQLLTNLKAHSADANFFLYKVIQIKEVLPKWNHTTWMKCKQNIFLLYYVGTV